MTVNDGMIDINLPIHYLDTSLLAFAKFKLETQQEDVADLKFYIQNFSTEITLLLSECWRQAKRIGHFNHCICQLKNQISNLTVDIDFVHAVQSSLVTPFTKKQSLQVLGQGL